MVAHCRTTSSCVGFAAGPHGNGNGAMPGVRKPSKAAPGTSVTGGMDWTGHSIAAALSLRPGCLGMKGGRQYSHGGQGAVWPLMGAPGEEWYSTQKGEKRQHLCLYEVTHFLILMCTHRFFPRSNEGRAEADFTLEQCFISLCNSVYFPWAKPNGKYLLDCKETLITVAYSSLAQLLLF